MESLWTPLFCFVVFTFIYGVLGDTIAHKTKAVVSGALVGCVVYLVGFLTGIFPPDAVNNTGILTIMANFGLALMIANLGTMIDLESLLKEWKTVVVGLFALVGVALICFTVGTWIFGKEYSLCAASPISGGLVATVMTTEAANEAGRPDLAAYATLVCSLQVFLGLPITSWCLKKEAKRMLASGAETAVVNNPEKQRKKINLRILPEWPEWSNTSGIIMCKLAFVCWISVYVSKWTHLNVAIVYLLLGVLFTEIGFLNRESLQKAGAFGFLMLCLLAYLPGNFSTLTWSGLLSLILPVIGMLVIGVLGIAVFSALAGKLLHYSIPMSIAIGLTALYGYPITQLVVDDIVKNLDAPEEQKQMVNDALLPKMLIGGFTTVTVASVVFAGIIVPMIF